MSRSFLLILAASVAIPLIAITGDSLWIDELMSAYLITADSLEGFDERVTTLNSSDIQMPFYMFYAFLWENVFGDSEWAMRLANLPWFVFGVVSFWHLLRDSPRLRLAATCLLLLSPFAWYYLNEVRPYAMQLSASCAVAACATRVLWGGRSLTTADLIITAIGLLAMAGASLLSIPWIGVFALLIGWAILRGRIAAPKLVAIAIAAVSTIVLFGLAVYFAKTLATGARAATAGGGLIQGLGFSVYELLGYAGLGPGRTELRQLGVKVFTPGQLAGIVVLSLAYLAVALSFIASRPKLDRCRHQLLVTAAMIALPMVFFVLLGVLKDFRVLGRHLAPLLPVIVLIVGAMVIHIRTKRLRSVTFGFLLLLLLASSILIRLAPRHQRDDYRQASQLVVSEFEKRRDVLWVANLAGLNYYRPKDVPQRAIGDRVGMHIHRFGRGDGTFPPETILMSKPEIHDPSGYARTLLKEGNYRLLKRFSGFEVWVR